MKVRTPQEVEQLVKQGAVSASVAKQLLKHFSSTEKPSKEPHVAQSTSKPQSRHAHKYASSNHERALREGRSEFYVLPEFDPKADPAVLLYRACVNRWGRAYEGGLVVHELGVDIPFNISQSEKPKRWYVDVAIPSKRICIEFDGYTHHTGLDAFKRDHLKTEQLQALGWYVFRVGTHRVKNDIDSFLDSVETLMAKVPCGAWTSHKFPGTKARRSFNSLLLTWAMNDASHENLNNYKHERLNKYE